MAWDTYLKIEGVDGESRREGHEKEIELDSFSLGGSNPSTVGMGSGGGSGTVTLSSFNVSKKTDAASALLFSAMCRGEHFAKATLTMYVSGGAKALEKIIFEFEEVFVDSISWGGSEGMSVPAEQVSFAYGKISITYNIQNPDGTLQGAVPASWDVRTVSAA